MMCSLIEAEAIALIEPDAGQPPLHETEMTIAKRPPFMIMLPDDLPNPSRLLTGVDAHGFSKRSF